MDTSTTPPFTGPFETRYRSFLETITTLRPSLHRYCARMTGSTLEGEDVVQEALFHAYRKLDTFDDSLPLKPWLFRIAHNRCIDYLRRRDVRQQAENAALSSDRVDALEPVGPLDRAVEHLVLALPPKERACVLLKDVLDYSLEEIADLVDSTVGGVKAALNRGRTKLASLPAPGPSVNTDKPEITRLLHLYVDRFNRRDWDGLRELISADARLTVADRFIGTLAESEYFSNYETLPAPWRLAVGHVDGAPMVIVYILKPGGWTPLSVVDLAFTGNEIVRIDDYILTPWVLDAALSVDTSEVS